MQMLSWKHIFFFLGALLFAILINSIMLRFVKTLGIRNEKETVIRWSDQVKPAIGGLGFYIVFLLSITLTMSNLPLLCKYLYLMLDIFKKLLQKNRKIFLF